MKGETPRRVRCACKFGVSRTCPRHGQKNQAKLGVLTTIAESAEFKTWFAKYHPFDWWAKERDRASLPHFDRILVRKICASAYEAAQDAERERCAKIADKAARKNQDALHIAASIPGKSITQHALITARDEALEIAAAIRGKD